MLELSTKWAGVERTGFQTEGMARAEALTWDLPGQKGGPSCVYGVSASFLIQIRTVGSKDSRTR